ncbi:MAG: hypothetical protein WA130_06405 [Candidatus Methanoperedens sp.]
MTSEIDKKHVNIKVYLNTHLNQFPEGNSEYWVETKEGHRKDARNVTLTGYDNIPPLLPKLPNITLHSRECVKFWKDNGFNTGMP